MELRSHVEPSGPSRWLGASAEAFVHAMAREIEHRVFRDWLTPLEEALAPSMPVAGPRHAALGALLPTVTS